MTDLPDLLTYDEVADYLRVSRTTVRRYVREGDLEAINTKGPRRRITRRSLEQFIRNNNP